MPKYEPFYDIVLETDIVGGTIAIKGSYDYRSGTDGTMKLQNADVTIENVDIVKGWDQSPVMALSLGEISGITMDYLTQTLEVDSVAFKEGSLFAKRLKDGQIDLHYSRKPHRPDLSPTLIQMTFRPNLPHQHPTTTLRRSVWKTFRSK